jgi:hypothetical protein
MPIIWGVILWLDKRFSPVKVLRFVILVFIPILMFMIPWWIRNFIVFNRFIPVTAGIAVNVWQGFGEFSGPSQNFWRFSNPFGACNDDESAYELYVKSGGKASYYSPQFSEDFYRPIVTKAIQSQPLWYLSLLGRRLVEIFIISVDWGFDPRLISSNIIRGIIHRSPTVLLFIMTGYGIFLSRKRIWDHLLILSVVLYYILFHLTMRVEGRYLYPGFAALLEYVGCSIVFILDGVRNHLLKNKKVSQ